jgi:octaprenyl-diphosphate synthase
MSAVNQIKAPVAPEMELFEKKFRQSMKSQVALLDKITHYIVKRKGKQMRPLFVFLTARMFGGVNESTHNAAALIELLHTATLVHDDVVDDAYQRRGFFSLNALWKNKIAVLVGDYLLSRGLLLSVEKGEFDLLRIVSQAVREMSEGELLQIEKTRKLNIDEEIYFDIIRQKTATLIAACCATGAASTGQNKETIEKARLFGEKVGIAFQIKDDLFDYGSGEDIGKPTGIDIKEKKTTLPLIYALNQAPANQRKRIINLVKNKNEDKQAVQEVIDFVLASGGIKYSVERMNEYITEAKNILATFPQNDGTRALEQLVDYTVNRKK